MIIDQLPIKENFAVQNFKKYILRNSERISTFEDN